MFGNYAASFFCNVIVILLVGGGDSFSPGFGGCVTTDDVFPIVAVCVVLTQSQLTLEMSFYYRF